MCPQEQYKSCALSVPSISDPCDQVGVPPLSSLANPTSEACFEGVELAEDFQRKRLKLQKDSRKNINNSIFFLSNFFFCQNYGNQKF